MSQHLDDRTGQPLPPLSAREREQQREAMVLMINAITTQVNTLTASVRALRERCDKQAARIDALELQVAWLSRRSWVVRTWRKWRAELLER